MLRKRDGKITLYHKRRKKSLEEKASCNFQQKRDDATTLSLMLGTLPYTQVYVGTFEVFVLAHVASRISSSPSWIRHPRQFLPPPAFFVYNYLKVKSARGTPKWNGVLEKKMRTCALKIRDKFSRELDFWLISILCKGGGTTGAIAPLEDTFREAKPPYPAPTHIHSTLIHRYFSVLTSVTCQLFIPIYALLRYFWSLSRSRWPFCIGFITA